MLIDFHFLISSLFVFLFFIKIRITKTYAIIANIGFNIIPVAGININNNDITITISATSFSSFSIFYPSF